MSNNLERLKSELRRLAKRCKDVKYTEGLLLAFLITGLLAFSETGVTSAEIKETRQSIDTSISDMKKLFKEAKQENNKLLKQSNLELIQLMEQGDHVVKSPWSSWQFGMNYFYGDWQGTYKGRGDKYQDEVYTRDQTLNRYKYGSSTSSSMTTYGLSTVGIVIEPNAAIPVNAALKPKIPILKQVNMALNVNISDLPAFNPRTVEAPDAPNVLAPDIDIPTAINLSANSLGNSSTASILGDNADGVIQGVIVTSGDIKTTRTGNNGSRGNWSYTLIENTNFSGVNSYSDSITSHLSTIGTINSDNGWKYTVPAGGLTESVTSKTGFFQISANNTGTSNITVNNSRVLYTNHGTPVSQGYIAELVHQDIHRGTKADTLKSKLNTSIGETTGGFNTVGEAIKGAEILQAYKNAVAYTNDFTRYKGAYYASGATTPTNDSLVLPFINSGDIIIEGKYTAFSNSYDHQTSSNDIAGLIINTGKIDMTPYQKSATIYEENKNAVFVVSPHAYGSGNQQTYYNSGTVNTWTKETAIYLLVAEGVRPVNIVNTGDGKLNMYAEKSSGIYIGKPANLNLNFTDGIADGTTITSNTANYLGSSKVTHTNITGINTYNPMTIYGDKSTGLYIPASASDSVVTGYFGVDVGDNTGNSNKLFSNNVSTTQGIAITARNVNPTIGTDSGGNYNNTTTTTYLGRTKTTNNTDIQGSAGIYSFGKLDLQGHQIRIYDNTDGNVGVYSAESGIIYDLGKGTMLLEKGKNNTAIAVASGKGKVISESEITLTGGTGNMAIYAATAGNVLATVNGETVKVKSINSTNTKNSIGIFADNGAYVKLTDGLTMTGATISSNPTDKVTDGNGINYGGENAGAVYAKGISSSTAVTQVDINRTALSSAWDIEITGEHLYDYDSVSASLVQTPKKYVGFGLFSNGANINSQYNKIKVTNGSTAVASINGGNIDLSNSTVYYSGEGYAFYTGNPLVSGNTGNINLTNGTLQLDGKAIGYVKNTGGTNWVNLTNATIDVLSDDVIIADLKTTSGTITLNAANAASPASLKDQVLGTGVTVTSSNGKTKYKYAVVDGATINITGAIDKADTTVDSDSEVFTKRLLYQNSIINVNDKVSANLNSTQLSSIDSSLTAPVGLAVSASGNSANTSTTGINNNNIVEADRTDAGSGAIGLYVDYGFINNSGGTVNVEKGTVNAANEKAIGIYGTNSTEIVNSGTVNVGGKNSIGILGLSYRLDSNGNPVNPSTEAYYVTSSSHYGYVDIENATNSKITMDDDGAVGIFIKNNSIDKDSSGNFIVTASNDRRTEAETVAVNDGTITINGSNNSVGMGANNGTIDNATNGIINVNGTISAGMYGTNTSILSNDGTINVVATSSGTESIGMYTDDKNTVINQVAGTINVGDNSYGIFGNKVNMSGGTIKVGDGGVGIYSVGPTVNLSGGAMTVGNNKSVGVYIAGTETAAKTVTGNVDIKTIGTDSFGYIVAAMQGKTDLTIGGGTTDLGGDSVFVYSAAPLSLGGVIKNSRDLNMKGSDSYGIYSSQDSENYGIMNMNSGTGNIGIYSTEGTGTNHSTINVGKTNATTEAFGIGMATGYYDKSTGSYSNIGTVVNRGTINVTEENSIGMYAVGSGSKAINGTSSGGVNSGIINLSGTNTVGMYIDRGAVGINYGTIQTTPNVQGTGIKGIVAVNGGIIKNYGRIIIEGAKNMGVYRDSISSYSDEAGGSNTSTVAEYIGTASDEKKIGSVTITIPPKSGTPTVSIGGVTQDIIGVDTTTVSPNATEVSVNGTVLNINSLGLGNIASLSTKEIAGSSLRMYVDTSGINYTNPIEGLQHLSLADIDLVFGPEAARYTNSDVIMIGNNILTPYNSALKSVTTTGTTLNVNSASLTWGAIGIPDANGLIQAVIMTRVPYTDLMANSSDIDTYNLLDGVNQRYGVEDLTSREKALFNKISEIGKGEQHIFTQAANEMKGYQYSNTQQRIYGTGRMLDKEISHLSNEWATKSKESNKIKAFGMRDEYNTDTAGVIDYKSDAYGFAYVHEDETVKLGNTTGWYAGAVHNRIKFKDLGGSKENITMLKAGVFKSTAFDNNGSLKWTISGEGYVARSNMHRKYLIVDEVFEAKSDYSSYGVAIKNEIGKEFRTSERTSIRPYGSLKLEYGRFSDIEEKSGEIRLEVEGNDYYSIRPEVGVEFKYKQPMAVRTTFVTTLGLGYESELGKVGDTKNKARVNYTTADWYNIRGEKDDRKGNFKADLNIGIENQRFGVTLNAGYDTKGENIRGGIGFRAIY